MINGDSPRNRWPTKAKSRARDGLAPKFVPCPNPIPLGDGPEMFSRLRADSSYLIGRNPAIAIITVLRLMSTFESANSQQTHELF